MAKLSVGDRLPPFLFRTHHGEVKSVSDDVLGTRTVFWIIRYIGCTVCRYDIHALARCYPHFLANNTQVFVVLQSEPETVCTDLSGFDIPFDIICDPEKKIYQQFDVLSAASFDALLGTSPEQQTHAKEKLNAALADGFTHGSYEGDELQLPAVWIVEPDGILSYVKYGETVADIPTPEELLNLIRPQQAETDTPEAETIEKADKPFNGCRTIRYEPKGVCAHLMEIDIEKGIIQAVRIQGGCSGNARGIASLLIGMTTEEAIQRLEGIPCGPRSTSCPDQLASALKQA